MTTEIHNLFDEPMMAERRKRKKAKSKQVFKTYQQHQAMFLPPSLEELIPTTHLVRIIDTTINGLNLEPLLATYEGGGTSAYHPLLLLKVLVYAYLSKIYASRRIAKALREDVNFMWIAGMSRPDFRTINGFRSSRLKEVLDQVFSSMALFLEEQGYIDLREYFVDGTKLQADSNRHKVVWSKNTKRYKEKVQQKIKELLDHIERTNDEEQKRYGTNDLEELGEHTSLTSDKVKEQIEHLNEMVQEQLPPKRTVNALKNLETKLLPKLEHYEQQEEILAGRNSYAKTDPDATVFRMKDEQLLPAYNLLVGTQHQFILGYSFHQQKASETGGLIPHLHHLHALLGHYPTDIVGDSAFGSEENYAFLADHQMANYLKYNTFHYEQTKTVKQDPYRKENFSYDPSSDTYRCPEGRALVLKRIQPTTTAQGYQITTRMYQCEDCRGCPVAGLCKRGVGNRTIQINPTLEAFRQQARSNLNSQRGLALRKQRGADIESVFGDLKHNQAYRRCRLRGQAKVNVEIGLLSMAHNAKKIASWSLRMASAQSMTALTPIDSNAVSFSFNCQRTFWTASVSDARRT